MPILKEAPKSQSISLDCSNNSPNLLWYSEEVRRLFPSYESPISFSIRLSFNGDTLRKKLVKVKNNVVSCSSQTDIRSLIIEIIKSEMTKTFNRDSSMSKDYDTTLPSAEYL